jgi:hypothetical protein
MMRKRTAICGVVVVCCLLASGVAMAQARGGPYDPGLPAPDYCCEQGVPNIPVGQKCMILHPVGEGENLHMLAAYYYGDARAWRVIYQYNKHTVRNPNVIRTGQVLQVYVDPCWAPRYNLEDFKSLERLRFETLNLGEGARVETEVISETMESKTITIGVSTEEEATSAETGRAGPGGGPPPLPPPPGGGSSRGSGRPQ